MQEGKFTKLCTCCGDVVQVVEMVGKMAWQKSSGALLDRTAESGCPPELNYLGSFRFLTGLLAAESSFAASRIICRKARTSVLSGR